jgi:hypothetical protein
MSDDAREQQRHGDVESAEGQQRSGEDYESPTVDDIPVDRPAVTEPGAPVVLVAGSPDGGGNAG